LVPEYTDGIGTLRLLEIIRILSMEKNIIINCYFTGNDFGNLKYIKDEIKYYNLEKQIKVLCFVEISTLLYLYKNAFAMLYISLLGPNNIPPIEAAVLGCPLIYSNIPGHLEQMENTGLAVNGTNPNEICEAIYTLYIDKEKREEIISNELIFSEKYRKYSYFEQLMNIFNGFSIYLKTWKRI